MNLKRIQADEPLGFRASRLPDTTLAVARALGITLIAVGLWAMWEALQRL